MTKDEAMLKLLALGGETKTALVQITGWPEQETSEVLDRLGEQRMVIYRNGLNQFESQRVYQLASQ